MDTLKLELLRLLPSKQQPLVQLPRDIIDGLQPGVDPLGDGLPDFVDQPLHLEVFERRTDNHVREERGGRERDEERRGDDGKGAEEVQAELVARKGWFARYNKLLRIPTRRS